MQGYSWRTRWLEKWVVLPGESSTEASTRRWRCDVLGWDFDNELVGPVRVNGVVKMRAGFYVDFWIKIFTHGMNPKVWRSGKSLFNVHDNAPSRAAKLATEYLNHVFARYGNIMQWPPCSPDINPIENLWSIVKRKMYSAGKQYHKVLMPRLLWVFP